MNAQEIAAKLSEGEREAWRGAERCGDYFLPPNEIYSDRDFRSTCFALGLLTKRPTEDEIEVSVCGHQFAAYMQTPRPTFWQRANLAVRQIIQEQTK